MIAVEESLQAIIAVAPSDVADLTQPRTRRLQTAATRLHVAVGDVVFDERQTDAIQLLRTTERLLQTKASVDKALQKVLSLRVRFGDLREDDRREAIRQFLETTTTLIGLSGRLRYHLRDAISTAAYYAATDRAKRLALIELLTEYESGIGAGVMSALLEDPPPQSRANPADDFVKGKVLLLMAATSESDLLPSVAKLIRDEETSPALVVIAAECVRRLGLPQDAHPRQATSISKPAITAKELYERLTAIDDAKSSPSVTGIRAELMKWLHVRMTKGVTEDSYRFFGHEVKEGDWFLMRNPSPYNLFTDLSPGLFTHVGVVTADVADDGIRRFVIVDLPERGATIPVTTVDAYLLQTLHYFFVRHPDKDVAQQMGEAALAMIGNPTQFDLNFDTKRVDDYRDVDLHGKKIHTYCAGFLLICAQRTESPRGDFFPIVEYPAPGNTQANLRTLGLSIGDDFVSPTAALFSPRLDIVGRRRPMYDPTREVKETVYDHFAKQMRDATLRQSPDAVQALRQKLVNMSEGNPWLRRAIAKASGVSEHMDLVSAAKAAAVVETLDEIADANMDAYLDAYDAFYSDSADELKKAGVKADRIEVVQRMRERHHELYKAWDVGQVAPHELQRRLVAYYSTIGRAQLDARFFTTP